VHRWRPLDANEIEERSQHYERVEDLMSSDLITVREDDLAELVWSLMCWSRIHHVPVESSDGELMGVVTAEILLSRAGAPAGASAPLLVRDVMDAEPAIVSPDSSVRDALALLQTGERDCLLVVSEGRLVGIVTERDYLKLAASALAEGSSSAGTQRADQGTS
jgi:CBS domain-containing membrane protein